MICSVCQKTREAKNDRLPKGWKRTGDPDERIYCDTCWRGRMVLRAIAMPVVEIVDGTWDEFRKAIREMWAATTQASNWMMSELYTRDVRRTDQPKLPPMARVYLYPETRKRFPQLPSQTVAALEQATQAKYRAKRYEVIWTCGASLPTYRYPTPFSVPNQGWSVATEEKERVVVSLRVGDRRWKVRLKGGWRYRRQLEAVRQIASGAAEQGALDLYQQQIDGKPQIMCKMVAWLPRMAKAKGAEGILSIRSTPESLLVATNAKEDALWKYHADQVRRWSAEHREQLLRWADDSKFEQRPVPSFTERRENAAQKYRHRMNSAVREIAASVAGYALRRKFQVVRYDDSDKSFCDGFPWFALRERLQTKLDEAGIEFEVASVEVPQ